ncbi:MAG: anhydro-N-acetylmuramic acid kinase [Bacteroidales bacterium]|nr:anhydro-N-acetylmuramic acid kinase [Bacteroidales bacterium]
MKTYKVIGVMSGTSLDGLDIAYCEFSANPGWNFKLICAETYSYDQFWGEKLSSLHLMEAPELVQTDFVYGRFIGERINSFIKRHRLSPDFIASHGHTAFHQPAKGLTLQTGNGNAISSITKLPVVFDFRAMDVALGGQGAPLVPIGDRLLFGAFDYCLNIGGIANISYEVNNNRIAWDICPANMVLNYLSRKTGASYDKDGELAASGKIEQSLLKQLEAWDYYTEKPPKSLGREDVEEFIFPLIENDRTSLPDLLRTYTEHISKCIGKVAQGQHKKMLITGGGAFNQFLISRIRANTDVEVVIPEVGIIEFKEALVFAFLGVLRMENQINCLASVTGAKRDCCCGIIAYT